MTRPSLTFACELDAARLTDLFADGSVTDDLKALGARVTMMVSDLSAERARVVQQLNQAGIPLVGIPLFPVEEGYYFTVDNAPRAADRYEEWRRWTAEHGLVWDWVGLDIEPEAQVYLQLMANPWGVVPMLLSRLRDHARVARAWTAYGELVDRIHADGWKVENYQFPFVADERRAGSTLVQRLMGLVDVRTDREVWMQYTSFVGPLGPGILWSYGPESDAIAVGTTGGGPDVPGHPQFSPLSWEELARICGSPTAGPTSCTSTASRGACGTVPGPAAVLGLDARVDSTDGPHRQHASGRAGRRPAHQRAPLARGGACGRPPR